jgi:hypothetical protein
MSDSSNVAKSLRERLGGNTEERFGKALSELLENPLLTGAISRAFDAREKAAQAQEVAMGALNLPSAADIERLTRRLRAVSHRLEGIEDGVDRLDRALTPSGVEARLSAIEGQLHGLTDRVEEALRGVVGTAASAVHAKPASQSPAAAAAGNAPKAPTPKKAKSPARKAKAPAAKKAKAAAKKAKGPAATRAKA